MNNGGGGDDLGCDDEYLAVEIRANDSDANDDKLLAPTSGRSKKRPKRVGSPLSSDGDSNNADQVANKKQTVEKVANYSNKMMLQAGRELQIKSISEQSSFINMVMQRHWSTNGVNDKDMPRLEAAHVVRSATNESDDDSFLVQLLSIISAKKIKKHQHAGSPAVVIVCSSARRAVRLLPALAPLKIRVAKLFPKNGSVASQSQELSSSIAVAVGTPHRLVTLLEQDVLTFDHTQLLVLDAAAAHGKPYTVCTLADTAPYVATLLKMAMPKLQGNTLKVAFL